MTTLPTFNFSKGTIKTSADLDKALTAEGNSYDQYFKPGKYEVKVIAAVHQGPAKNNPTWQKFLLTLKGAGKATVTYQIAVPFETIEYVTSTGKNPLFMYTKLVKLMAGLGVTLTPENLGEVLPQYFGAGFEKALMNRQLSVEVGYRGNFIKYMGKNGEGKTQYQVQLSNGTLMPEVFADFKAAEAHAGSKGIEVSRFVEVTDIAASANGAAGLKVANSNW